MNAGGVSATPGAAFEAAQKKNRAGGADAVSQEDREAAGRAVQVRPAAEDQKVAVTLNT